MNRHLIPTLTMLGTAVYLVAEPVSYVSHLPPMIADFVWVFLGLLALGVFVSVPRFLRSMTTDDFLFPPVPTALLVVGLFFSLLMPILFPGMHEQLIQPFRLIVRWMAGMTTLTYIAGVGSNGDHGSIEFGKLLCGLGGIVGLHRVKARNPLDAAIPENPAGPLVLVAVIVCLFTAITTRFNFKTFDARPEPAPAQVVGPQGEPPVPQVLDNVTGATKSPFPKLRWWETR